MPDTPRSEGRSGDRAAAAATGRPLPSLPGTQRDIELTGRRAWLSGRLASESPGARRASESESESWQQLSLSESLAGGKLSQSSKSMAVTSDSLAGWLAVTVSVAVAHWLRLAA